MSVQSQIERITEEVAGQNDLIQQIKTVLLDKAAGGVELPTLENPGSASDLAQGKQLIDADGSVVEGNVKLVESNSNWGWNNTKPSVNTSNGLIGFNVKINQPDASGLLYRNGSNLYIRGNPSEFGNATPDQVAKGATFTSEAGLLVEGSVGVIKDSDPWFASSEGQVSETKNNGEPVLKMSTKTPIASKMIVNSNIALLAPMSNFGNATPADVRQGVTFTSSAGLLAKGEALLPDGGFVFPDGAFAPVTNFTDGKQYALVAMIDGVRRYINTTTYNDYTMNATQITIGEDAGDYVIFSATPVLFTAVASGDGFLLQNGSNYLHGTSSGGTALRFGTTQMVWTVDTSANGGFSDGKYYAKEDSNAVWLMNADGGYAWSIKYETAGSFGYDRDGRDSTYSTGFVPFVLYEYVAGEGEVSPVVDTSDANVTANKMLDGYSGYANGRKVEGNIQSRGAQTITPSTTAQEIPAGVYLEGKQTIAAIQTETKSVTENGTYTPSNGKYFSSFTVNVPAGSSGSVIKTGTTTSGTINTGLSDIEQFFIYKESVTATGLIHLHYTKSATSRMYASAWTTSNYGTKTITNGTGGVTVSGGTLTISATQAAQGALTSGVTYKWVAIGK